MDRVREGPAFEDVICQRDVFTEASSSGCH